MPVHGKSAPHTVQQPASPLTDTIAAAVPNLRRYARALTGSAASGDAYVRMVLETLVQDGVGVLGLRPDRVALFRLFHRIYAGGHLELGDEGLSSAGPRALLHALPAEEREALLLTAVEGFTAEETALIMGLPLAPVRRNIHLARAAIADRLRTGVLIIEDDMMVARHLKKQVAALDHEILAVARTRQAAMSRGEGGRTPAMMM
ncbi:MAG: sigma factor-like helix-turn-helix DNA-binding protein [Azospirillaceae bacterium]|nr:sigma factor-like helix-turn-helix DNA-binding protein [Azospirillaceae bacterium]